MSAASSSPGPLGGVTVLDLSTVGPAARCTRLLADYGARVVKVGPVPSAGATPIEPPYFAYSGHRGMHRVLLDLKDSEGREAFLALAAAADVVVESFRPGVVDRLGIGYDTVSARNAGIVYCSTSGYGQRGPRADWAGHDIDYLAVGGYLAMSTPGLDGAPPLPGATVADAAAGGMQAALAITVALAARAASGRGAYLDVSVADGVLWLMSLLIDEHLALGTSPRPGHDLLTGRYACYATYRAGDGKWLAVGAIESKFFANLCTALGCPEFAGAQLDDDVQPAIRAAFASAFATRTPRPVGGGAGERRYLRGPRPRGFRGCRPSAILGSRSGDDGPAPDPWGPAAAGAPARWDGTACGTGVATRHDPDRLGAPLEGGRRRRRDGRPLGGPEDRGVSGADVVAEARDRIGKEQYPEVGEFPVERGYVWTSCASVENGNPLFWDDDVADTLTGGPVAPPSMVSVWFRPHHWAPGRTKEALPLQVHFDLKEHFGLPEAVMTDNTIEFHTPVRMGDVLRTHQILRSISDEKTTKLGTGRFWVIDVLYSNADGELVAVESYTGFGYRRDDST